MTEIRTAVDADWPGTWAIVREVAAAAETFPYDPDMTEEQGRALWWTPPPGRVVVAVDGGSVLGTANMYANRAGPGGHVASGSLMVGSGARGRGVGRALAEEMVGWARQRGFAAVQFNAVVETNAAAVGLYEKLGFRTVGVVPGAFRHPVLGEVGLLVMWLDLRAARG